MKVRILGAAAGGGLPQWNCQCSNCHAVRGGSTDVKARTQSSVAVSADGDHWFLLNVSADVRQQVSRCEELWPRGESRRGTSIAGCILTDAEIDHTSGLLQLREGCRIDVYTTSLVRRWLTDYLPLLPIVSEFAERPWRPLALDTAVELTLPDGRPCGLTVRAFETGRDAPRFVPEDRNEGAGSVIGLSIHHDATNGKLVYAPGVSAIDATIQREAGDASCVMLDGTFWSDDEPIRIGISQRTSMEMGHLPVSGDCGSLPWLSGLAVRHRVYVHINNTNPMLNESGPEYQKVRNSGIRVGADGDVYEL